jgi:hypothetical protein
MKQHWSYSKPLQSCGNFKAHRWIYCYTLQDTTYNCSKCLPRLDHFSMTFNYSTIYLNFLKNKLPLLMQDKPLQKRHRIFLQHDGARPHFSCQVIAYLNQHYNSLATKIYRLNLAWYHQWDLTKQMTPTGPKYTWDRNSCIRLWILPLIHESTPNNFNR